MLACYLLKQTTGNPEKEECLLSQQDAEEACVVNMDEGFGALRRVKGFAAFLATVTTRLCINLAQSAQSRRETYVGTWLPEPVDTSSDPA